MKSVPSRWIAVLIFTVAAASLMYFVPALAAIGAVVYVVRVALSTEPIAREETTSKS